MNSIEIAKDIVVWNGSISYKELHAHEQIIETKEQDLINYLNKCGSKAIIPSIIVCSMSKMIIDGHHRYNALQKIGIKKIPVTYVNYYSDLIYTNYSFPHIDKNILIKAALCKNLFPPKSSSHHIKCKTGDLHPIIVLSVLHTVR